jgi:beta-lactamase superfamily II metal-dependent hydrolase
MPCEIDMLPIGDKKSGDALCVRYGNPQIGYSVLVIDGGYSDNAQSIIQHVETFYGTRHIDHMILTHADNDHASGLIEVLRHFTVGTLWMNCPWLYAAETLHKFHKNYTLEGLIDEIRSKHDSLVTLEKVATAKRTPVLPAFQGQVIGPLTVLAPSRQRYIELLPDLDRTPTSYGDAATAGLGGILGEAVRAAIRFIRETWTGETLSNNPEPTSASNETSLVQLMEHDGRRMLFTSDVGPKGLTEAATYANNLGKMGSLDWVQVPHHGSRRNVTPQTLDWWLGTPLPDEGTVRGVAFCSAAVNDKEHPRKKVENGFRRRGYPVHTTHGMGKRHPFSMGNRPGWVASVPSPFWNEVEE